MFFNRSEFRMKIKNIGKIGKIEKKFHQKRNERVLCKQTISDGIEMFYLKRSHLIN